MDFKKMDEPQIRKLEYKELGDFRLGCVAEIQGIQAQLSAPNRTHPDGSRFSDHEYHDWRGRAVVAMNALTKKLRFTNSELKRRGHNSRNGESPRLKALVGQIVSVEIGVDALGMQTDVLDQKFDECVKAAHAIDKAWEAYFSDE